MTVTFQRAKREDVPLLLGLAGGTGSGKTTTAMLLAKGISGGQPFAVIDTENGRAKHYADQFTFDWAPLTSPFRPAAYIEAILAAADAGYRALVVDSMSHEWAGDGGLLDWHDEEMGDNQAKKMSAWIKPKMAHKKLVTLLTTELPPAMAVILCFRAEPKVDMVKQNGRWEIVPKASLIGLDGWIPITEKNLPFELTLSLLLLADQPGVPHPIKLPGDLKPFVPLDKPLNEMTGVALAEWAAGKKSPAADAAAVDQIPGLITDLLERAARLDKRDSAVAAIDKNRKTHAEDLVAHVRWLRAQVKRFEAAEAAASEALEAGASA